MGSVFGYSFSFQSLLPTLIGIFMIIIGFMILIIKAMKKEKYTSQQNKKELLLENRVCPLCLTTLDKEITHCPTCGKKI